MKTIRRQTPVEEALSLLLERTPKAWLTERVSLEEAPGRVASTGVVAGVDQPPFDKSPLDGFALSHRDIADAGEKGPVRLRVVRTIYAGDGTAGKISRGEAVRVMTGAPLPEGATCVVRQEDTSFRDGSVAVCQPRKKFDNYIFRGEEARDGDILVRPGDRLDAGHVALMAGQGAAKADVFRKPRVGILSTGNELAVDGPLPPGKIFNTNGPMLAALTVLAGGTVSARETAPDDPEALADAVRHLLTGADVVVTTGGVSVGERDCMPDAAALLEAKTLFHGMAVKPGSPAMGLLSGGKPVICLSGNPFAVFVTFALLVRPVLRRLAGETREEAVRAEAVLATDFRKKSKTRRMVPARLTGGEVVIADGGCAGRNMASLVGANCLIDIPAGTGRLTKGDSVEVILL